MVQAGDLGRSGWKEADVERWVTAWGGVFAGDLSSRNNNNNHDADITHILATQAQFKDRKNARVARARKMRGKDAPHFVTADWLEDCICARRRLPEREFSLRERQRKEDAKRRRAERAEKGIEKGKRLVNDCKSLSSFCLSIFFFFFSHRCFCFYRLRSTYSSRRRFGYLTIVCACRPFLLWGRRGSGAGGNGFADLDHGGMAAWAGINHVYSDSTFFRYDIELTRNDKESGNVGQKYQICVSTILNCAPTRPPCTD